MVVPALTTLLSNTTWQKFRNLSPISRAKNSYFLAKDPIFLLRPSPLTNIVTLVGQFEPSHVALDLRLAFENFTDAVPGSVAVLLYQVNQLLILKAFRLSSGLTSWSDQIATYFDFFCDISLF